MWSFGVTDLVTGLAESDSAKVNPTAADCIALCDSIIKYHPLVVVLLHGTVLRKFMMYLGKPVPEVNSGFLGYLVDGCPTALFSEGFYPITAVALLTSGWLYLLLRKIDMPVPHAGRSPLWSTWREMRGLLLPLSGILCARGFMNASLATFLPTFIEQETGSLWMGGIALTVFESAGVAGVLAAGTLSDRYGRRRTLLCSLAGAPVALFLFAAGSGAVRLGALAVTGFALLSATPVMLAMVQERATRSPAAANGLSMMVSFLARSAIVVLVGMCGDRFGLQITYYVSALLGLAGIPFLFLLPGSKQKPLPVSEQDEAC